ncbi:MAG: fimbrillin family protein [Prevotellaceae bacterium]|jgi:hypothetical protein|nr:fimbrillin family protein [Prevotellaceae bacterium]
MKTRKHIPLWVAAAMLTGMLTACSNQSPELPASAEHPVKIHIVPSLATLDSDNVVATRGAVENQFPANATIGLCVINSGSGIGVVGDPNVAGYDNVRGMSQGGGSWRWYNGVSYLGSILSGFSNRSDEVKIYGYAPFESGTVYDKAAGTLTVPFSLGTDQGNGAFSGTEAEASKDYMVCRPVTYSMSTPSPYSQLYFYHLMSCLRFSIRREIGRLESSNLPEFYIKEIILKLETKAGDPITGVLTGSGTFNAMTPFFDDDTPVTTLDDIVPANSIQIEFNKILPSSFNWDASYTGLSRYSYAICDFLLPELATADIKVGTDVVLVAEFSFSDAAGNDYIFSDGNTSKTFRKNLDEISFSGGASGLLHGIMYNFEVVVGNYVRFNAVPDVSKITLNGVSGSEASQIII